MFKIYRSGLFKIFLIVAISLAILVGAVFFQGFRPDTYTRVYRQGDIGQNTGYSEVQYLEEIENYRRYLLDEDDLALTDDSRYSQDEIRHMEDVRGLFEMARRFGLGTLFMSLFFILIMDGENLRKLFKLSFLIPLIPAIFILPALFNFGRFWIFFHKIFFRNDLWLMDPDQSLMINLLPEEVFNAISISVIKTFLFGSFLMIGFLYILYRIRRRGYENK